MEGAVGHRVDRLLDLGWCVSLFKAGSHLCSPVWRQLSLRLAYPALPVCEDLGLDSGGRLHWLLSDPRWVYPVSQRPELLC